MDGRGALAERADVVVVGGGPAGSITAGLLARAGYHVLLLDRSAFPRAKPCGESINPGAVGELAHLGLLPEIQSQPHNRMTGWRVHPRQGEPFEGRFPEGEYAIAMDRPALDSVLLEFARRSGVVVQTGVRVTDLVMAGGGVRGVVTAAHGTIGARLVVGADGLRSVVVRRLGLIRRRPRLLKVALTGHVIAAGLPLTTGILTMARWGCLGIAPLAEGQANVVVVLDRAARGLAAGDPTACFDRLLSTSEYLRGAVRVSDVLATGPFDWPTRGVTADGALVVGDAAGYFDPLTGQGIFRALRGARDAAEVACDCLRSSRVTARALQPYQRRHRRAFAAGAAVQRVIEIGVGNPRMFSAAAAVFRSMPPLADALLGLTGDVPPTPREHLPRVPERIFSA